VPFGRRESAAAAPGHAENHRTDAKQYAVEQTSRVLDLSIVVIRRLSQEPEQLSSHSCPAMVEIVPRLRAISEQHRSPDITEFDFLS